MKTQLRQSNGGVQGGVFIFSKNSFFSVVNPLAFALRHSGGEFSLSRRRSNFADVQGVTGQKPDRNTDTRELNMSREFAVIFAISNMKEEICMCLQDVWQKEPNLDYISDTFLDTKSGLKFIKMKFPTCSTHTYLVNLLVFVEREQPLAHSRAQRHVVSVPLTVLLYRQKDNRAFLQTDYAV